MDTIRDRRGFKFGKLPEKVLYSRKLSSNAKVVYAVLDKHAGNETMVCFPGQERVADLTGMSRPTVVRSIQELVSVRLVKVVKKTSRKGLRNEYQLLSVR
jgi:hypothetical protein